MVENVAFEYKLADDDFRAASKVVARKIHRRLWGYLALYAALLVLLYSIRTADLPLFAFGAILGIASMTVCGLLSYRRQVEKMWKALPSMHEENQISLSNDGIRASTPTANTHFQWSHFQAFQEQKTHFFLMLGPHPLLWFPKRAIAEGDQDEVRAWLKEKLPPIKK